MVASPLVPPCLSSLGCLPTDVMASEKKGRAKDYTRCWNCQGYVGKSLLNKDHYDGECPLCGADIPEEDVT